PSNLAYQLWWLVGRLKIHIRNY
ncbi:hypothetical protein AZ047_005322, partial [Klebsiella pneumoniae]